VLAVLGRIIHEPLASACRFRSRFLVDAGARRAGRRYAAGQGINPRSRRDYGHDGEIHGAGDEHSGRECNDSESARSIEQHGPRCSAGRCDKTRDHGDTCRNSRSAGKAGERSDSDNRADRKRSAESRGNDGIDRDDGSENRGRG
jgi:hypothetical protein